ncbi:MAG: hypothetical protein IKI64_02515 [Clostridia bacterium]|nr:hypothetical protein [Clostridia bacterium]
MIFFMFFPPIIKVMRITHKTGGKNCRIWIIHSTMFFANNKAFAKLYIMTAAGQSAVSVEQWEKLKNACPVHAARLLSRGSIGIAANEERRLRFTGSRLMRERSE